MIINIMILCENKYVKYWINENLECNGVPKDFCCRKINQNRSLRNKLKNNKTRQLLNKLTFIIIHKILFGSFFPQKTLFDGT